MTAPTLSPNATGSMARRTSALRRLLAAVASAVCAVLMGAAPASAQVFGTYSWQMQPYCNVVTLTLTKSPAGFALDGVDDQCGAANKAGVSGFASFNANGNVTVNFTIVAAPSAKAVQVSAIVSPANGSGSWMDSVGNRGALTLGARTGGAPRPLPSSGLAPAVITTTEIAPNAVGGADINTAEVQARVAGVCPTGQAMSGINANGSVTCEPVVRRQSIGGAAFVPVSGGSVYRVDSGCAYVGNTLGLIASVQVPVGYQVTGMSAVAYDDDGFVDLSIQVRQFETPVARTLLSVSTSGNPGYHVIAGTVSSPRTIASGNSVSVVYLPGYAHYSWSLQICSVELTLTKP